jgi:hypothetical protein
MIALDGTENKEKLGANATLAVSLAARVLLLKRKFLFSNISQTYVVKLFDYACTNDEHHQWWFTCR